jgi:LmbE family N-acetylglucosaminyl deacetylase
MKKIKVLVIGAHPDDADLMFGGTAAKMIRNGHVVKFVSLTNGSAGHLTMKRKELASRRRKEADCSAAAAGLVSYDILDIDDGQLTASLENRDRVIRLIREFSPDIVISNRLWDYHADHRAAAQLVQDSAYLVIVPSVCPEVPITDSNPVYLSSYDDFQRPCPFTPAVTVSIDDSIEEKKRMMDCHKSQFYEWLPWTMGRRVSDEMSMEEKYRILEEDWLIRNVQQADLFRDKLKEFYPESNDIRYVESFELSEYGRQPESGELSELLITSGKSD